MSHARAAHKTKCRAGVEQRPHRVYAIAAADDDGDQIGVIMINSNPCSIVSNERERRDAARQHGSQWVMALSRSDVYY